LSKNRKQYTTIVLRYQLRTSPNLVVVMALLDKLKAEKRTAFWDRCGDRKRDLALYLDGKRGEMRLRDLANADGGGSIAVRRFEERLRQDKKLATLMKQCLRQLGETVRCDRAVPGVTCALPL
jgi:hypothetical protein